MRYQYRPKSISTWAFWTALLMGSALYLAHRLDWFPIAFLPQSTAPEEQATTGPAPGNNTPPQAPPDGQIEVAQSPAGPQSEPPQDDTEPAAPGQQAHSAKARLMEQRAEAAKPQLHANAATPSTVEPTNIDDVEVSRASFATEAKPNHGNRHAGDIVQASHVVEQPETPRLDPDLTARLEKIDGLLATHDLPRAHRELSTIYWSKPQWRTAIRDRIERTAQAIYFDPKPHVIEPYVVQPNDEFAQFAKRYQVPWEYLAKLNRIDPKRLQPGQRLKVIEGPFSAIVELGANLLTVHAYGYYVKAYRIGIGQNGSTPIGKFSVINKVTNPQYTDPQGRVVLSDDPANPLGTRWIDLGDGYGIHGTIDPDSVGKAESRGCIRMRNEDVAEAFDMLAVGSDVTIRR